MSSKGCFLPKLLKRKMNNCLENQLLHGPLHTKITNRHRQTRADMKRTLPNDQQPDPRTIFTSSAGH